MKKWMCIAAIVVVLGGLLSACSGEAFQGSVTATDTEFRMVYTILNETKTATLVLGAGDSLRVTLAHTAGSVDVRVGIAGEEPVYEGSALGNADFTLNIQSAGQYEITVTGFSAQGSAAFVRSLAEQPGEAPGEEATGETLSTEDMVATLTAYQFALQQISFEHVYPDGTDTGFDSTCGYIEDNFFAIQDVTGDDRKELIVRFVTAPEAGKQETVFTFNPGKNTVGKLLTISPEGVYYDNSIVKENWARGSGLCAAEYWPYNLYRFNEATGSYELFAEVNMWSKSVTMVDYKGDTYPEEIDTEKAGTVFIVSYLGVTKTISKSDYEAWLAEILGDAQPLELSYRNMSEKNIENLYG